MGDGNGMRPLKAEAVAAGDRLLTPAAGTAAEVVSTEVQRDDFGTPALVVATLRSGETLRIAAGSDVQIAGTAASGVELGADAGDGEQPPETVVAHAAAVHPESAAAGQIASRLARGVNLRSGANLQDLSHLAELLFADLADSANALRVCELLAPLPYDGNYGRWKWIGCSPETAATGRAESVQPRDCQGVRGRRRRCRAGVAAATPGRAAVPACTWRFNHAERR
jgi:hypothetical protein